MSIPPPPLEPTADNVEYEEIPGLPFSTTVSHLLPVELAAEQILQSVKLNQVTIISAETGSGKTTKIPVMLYHSGWFNGNIQVTQPRVIAAKSCSQRVAKEMNTQLGNLIGYAVGGEHSFSDSTRIVYQTEGVLLRKIQQDPLLRSTDVVILDEAHELTLEMELLIGLLKIVCQERPDFRLVICSATCDQKIFTSHFSGNALTIPGRSFPVTLFHSKNAVDPSKLMEAVFQLLEKLHKEEDEGDILVFLSGSSDIDAFTRCLQEQRFLFLNFFAVSLYAALDEDEKSDAISSQRLLGKRKVIFSTNIAETSLTLPHVTTVIDTGFEKMDFFDVRNNSIYLRDQIASKSSANQRAGRAGRIRPGQCYRLFTKTQFENRSSFPTPAIVRSNVECLCLTLHSMNKSLHQLELLHYPPKPHIEAAEEQLYTLGALQVESDGSYRITEFGKVLNKFPISPEAAVTLLQSTDLQCQSEVLSVVSVGASDGIFRFPSKDQVAKIAKKKMAHEFGDPITCLLMFEQFLSTPLEKRKSFCRQNYLILNGCNKAEKIRQRLSILLTHNQPETSCNSDYLRVVRSYARGYARNSAMLDNDEEGDYKLRVGNATVSPHPSSFLSETRSSFIVAARSQSNELKRYLFNISASSANWVFEDLRPHYFL